MIEGVNSLRQKNGRSQSTARRQIAIRRWLKRPFVRQLMLWGIRLVVPKQRIGVGLIVMDQQNRILLLNHLFHPVSPWGLPGGWLEREEAPAEGALRELREETGITAVVGPPVHIAREKTPSHIGMAFLAWADSDQPIVLSHEITEARWFTPETLPDGLLLFVRQAIQKAVTANQLLGDAAARHEFTGFQETNTR